LIGIPAVYGILVAAGEIPRLIFFILISIVGQYELTSILSPKAPYKPVLEWMAGIAVLVSTHFFSASGLLASFSVSITAIMILTVLRGLKGDGTQRFSNAIFSVFYLPFCLSFFLMIGMQNGGLLLFSILASIWALDIGAYIFGMSIRGPKLAPKISPNKTISGAVGGMISTLTFFFLLNKYGLLQIETQRLVPIAISVSVVGQIADLFESVLKRESDVKDSGGLLGAHGGILDRIDSVLFLGPICYSLLTY
jgi:phosphatidate cytidylyltransferase